MSARELVLGYGSSDDVVGGVSLELAGGDRLAVVGRSGCGKSTLLHALAGVLVPRTGELQVRDRSASESLRRGTTVLAHQEPALLPWRDVVGNAVLRVQLARRLEQHDRSEARRLLDLVEIPKSVWHLKPDQLSGGMRQRLGLVGALVGRPSLLLLDEPFASVDELTRLDLVDVLVECLDDSGATCVLVTHSIHEAVVFADRVMVLAGQPAAVTDVVEIGGGRASRTQRLVSGDLDRSIQAILKALRAT